MTDSKGPGPTPEAIATWITTTWPETIVAEAMGATFFSLDPSSWPNFATIVTTDEHDMGTPSNLTARPDVFRLNIGVGKATFERLAAVWSAGDTEPDPAELDTLLPHPVYAKQRWVSILNPSHATFDAVVKRLLGEAHDRLAVRYPAQP
ncbi:MAG TPA: DUF6194 family protein [Candidatus Limnocylindrales bacterium]|nr:DUF6194 family protein [Candidatus Limnocylindrales bacterium]